MFSIIINEIAKVDSPVILPGTFLEYEAYLQTSLHYDYLSVLMVTL